MPIKRLLITVIILFYSKSAFALLARPTSFDDRGSCEESKGVWRQFGNGCAGSCEAKLDQFAVCTQALVYACDCGSKRCWDGKSCVVLAEYEKIYKAKMVEEQKVLDEAKKKRQAMFKSYREQILVKLKNQSNPADPNAPQGSSGVQSDSSQIDFSKPRESSIVINDPGVQTGNGSNNLGVAGIQPPVEEPQAEIPPLYLQKQAKKQQEIDNSKNSSNNPSSDAVFTPAVEVPPGLPEIKVPN